MHELSIVMSVLDAVTEAAARARTSRVLAVRLRIGELSSVDPDALSFAYTASTEGHPLFAGSRLEVEWVPIRVFCPMCEREGSSMPHSITCAACGNSMTRVVAGEELDIASVEVEQDGKPAGDRPQGPVQE